MSQLLVSELTSLSSEARRKHPEIKQVVDTFLARFKSDNEGTLAACRNDANPALEHPLLKPVLLSCQTKLPKVISLALSLLQRVLLQRLVPPHTIPTVIATLNSLVKAGRIDVDVQLKILQIASALLSSYPSIHNNDLAETLMLGFRLQETSKVAVVSSTAAATLRQSVMTVFDKVKDEDAILDSIKEGGEEAAAAAPLAALSVDIPGSASVTLFPSSRDAYLLFSDLCSLASGEEAKFLSLNTLSKTFSLELIESILTNHPLLFTLVKGTNLDTAHPELLFLLRSRTCPLLIKSLSEPPAFPIYLRLMRLLFLLLRQFSGDLVLEVEILMTILLRNVYPTPQDIKSHGGTPPTMWQQVLALEVLRSLCSNDVFLRCLWEWYDAEEGGSDSVKIFSKLVETLQNALVQGEKIFAIEPSMTLVPDPASAVPESPQRSKIRESFDRSFSSSGIYEAAAGVASAAMSGVFQSANGTGVEILSVTSSPTVQIIDQLDKVDPPAPGSATLPKTYPQLLALQSFHFLAQSLAGFALPIYSKFVNARPPNAAPAPPAITDADFSSLKSQADRAGLKTTRDMLNSSAERISDVLSRCLRIKSTDTIFEETLLALRNLTNVTGALGLLKQRNVIILSFIPFGVPAFDSSSPLPPSLRVEVTNLSNRNLACLRAFAQVVYYLSGSLGTFWYPVLNALCVAQTLLTSINSGVARRGLQSVSEADTDANDQQSQTRNSATLSTLTHTASLDSRSGKSQLQLLNPTDLQPAQIESQIRNIFQNTSSLGDDAFFDFISSLCKLSGDLLDASSLLAGPQGSFDGASPRTSGFGNINRRSRSGIKAEDLPFYPVSCITLVASLNIGRLSRLPSTRGWDLILDHLLTSLASSRAPSSWRLQAAETVNVILFSAMGEDALLSDSKEHLRLQQQVFAVFEHAGILPDRSSSSTDLAIRTLTVSNLQKVLETFGHALVWGWDVLFAVCRATCVANAAGQTAAATKSQTNLVKAGFSCLQLICSDYLSSLDRVGIRSCVECLKAFGQQTEDVNVALTSIGCLWGVTAEMASRANSVTSRTDTDDLWLLLLHCLLDLAQDSRSEVRNGAISNLFQVLQQYGDTLDPATWTQIANTILFPLIRTLDTSASRVANEAESVEKVELEAKDRDAALMGYLPSELKQWQESQSLALEQLGEVTRDFLVSKLIKSDGFASIWASLLSESKAAFLNGPATNTQAAIKCLTMALSADLQSESGNQSIAAAWKHAWETWVQIGQSIPEVTSFQFTQKNLLAYIQAFPHLYRIIEPQFDAERSQLVLACLRACTAYSQCLDQSRDVDNLSNVQEAARTTAKSISGVRGVTPLLLTDLSNSICLTYSATGTAEKGSTKPTFVALSRTAIAEALPLFFENEHDVALYTEGAVESLLNALKLPIKLKYDCPPSTSAHNKGKHLPLWQQATLAFCKISQRCCRTLHERSEQLGHEKVTQIWTTIIDILEAALLADSTGALELAADEREADERFGLFVLFNIETSILSFLGTSVVPDELIERLAAILAKASTLYSTEEDAFSARDGGRLDDIIPVINERLAYWSFDLLFLACSEGFAETAEAEGRNRIATIFSHHLIKRCETVLSTYVEDVSIRGMMPMHRVRGEETNYVLDRYLDLRLIPGCFANAGQTQWRLSPVAHLFSAYRHLIALLQIPRQAGASQTIASIGTSLPSILPSKQDWDEEVAKHGLTSGIIGQQKNALRKSDLNEEPANVDKVDKVEARDLAARALQLVGDELQISTL